MVRTISLPPPAVLHTPKPPVALSVNARRDLTRPDSWECSTRPSHFIPPSSGRDCPLPPLPKSLGLRSFEELYPEPDSPCTPYDSLESLLQAPSPPETDCSEKPRAPRNDCGGRGGGHLQLHLSGSDFMRPFTPSFLFSTMFAEDSPESCVFRDSPLDNIEDSVDEGSFVAVADDGSFDDDCHSDIISSSCTLLGAGWQQSWATEDEGALGVEVEYYPVLYWGEGEGDHFREKVEGSIMDRETSGETLSRTRRSEDVLQERRLRTHASRKGRSCMGSLLCFC